MSQATRGLCRQVFNTYQAGAAHDFATSGRAVKVVAAILGEDIDVFQ